MYFMPFYAKKNENKNQFVVSDVSQTHLRLILHNVLLTARSYEGSGCYKLQ